MKGMVNIEFKKIEEEIIPIYENESKERLINARELHQVLKNKRQFANWIKQRIEQYGFVENKEYIRFNNFVKGDEKGYGNKAKIDYYLTIDMAKELCMVENNEMGKKLRIYFIEIEKRFKGIISNPSNIFDFMRLALDEIEKNEIEIKNVKTLALKNKEEIYYEIQYIKNTKNGKKGEVKERGFKIENISYKIQ